jgi:D-Tyr-tRNAtyr deacylase
MIKYSPGVEFFPIPFLIGLQDNFKNSKVAQYDSNINVVSQFKLFAKSPFKIGKEGSKSKYLYNSIS